jgi:hyperosmotically inducible protein
MFMQLFLNRSTVFVLLTSLTLVQAGYAAKDDKERHTAFIRGGLDETRLMHEVRHQLVMLPYYGVFDDLSFRVDPDGGITLMGAVTRPTLKSEAENVTKQIEGVTKVVNQIEVLPLSPQDDRIRMAEYRAIYGDPALATRYGYRAIPPVHIVVKNGHVTLDGVVANQGDKDLINVRANSVPGVFSVTNNLTVESN